MTQKEFSNIVGALKSVYADPKFIPDAFALSIWYKLLGEHNDYNSVSVAIQTYMLTGKRPPTPADIIDCLQIQDASVPDLTEQEAWALVAKACSNGNYGWKEEFAKLPPLVKRAVGSENNIHQWAAVNIDEFQTVIQSNFMRSYRAVVKADKEYRKYPDKLKELVSGTVQKMITN